MGGRVRGRRASAADKPLRRSSVEAAGDRVFGGCIAGDERPNFEVRVFRTAMRSDHTHLQSLQGGIVGHDVQDLACRVKEHAYPGGAVDQPCSVQEGIARQSEARRDLCHVPLIDGSGSCQWGRRKSQPFRVPLYRDQPCAAFLDEDPVLLGNAAGFKPCMRGSEGRVPGEWKLLVGRKDPDPVIGLGVGRRQEECGLGQVGPVGELLHLLRREVFGVNHHGERVASVVIGGEHVHLGEGATVAQGRGVLTHRCRLSPDLEGLPRVCETTGMAENKTKPTSVSAEEFLAALEHPRRRADGFELLDMMRRITGQEAVMWGPTIVGFGTYHYRYGTGREGDAAAVGFSPRKANLVLYGLTDGPDADRLLPELGKHRTSTACLYVNKLDDVDRDVLADLVRAGYRYVTTELHSP